MMGTPGRFVREHSPLGAILWKWEPPVPYIEAGVLGSSIFLYGSVSDADRGSNWGGSGVLVGVPSMANPAYVHLYAVSNDHVVHDSPVVRLVKANGQRLSIPGTEADWHSHRKGDDIALRPLGTVPDRDYWRVPVGMLLSRDQLGPRAIGPGDNCLMVGRYIDRESHQFDQPVARFGNIAMLPEHVVQDKRGFLQESFLVDMRSQPGFSGSPVYVYFEVPGWRAETRLTPELKTDSAAKTKALQHLLANERMSGIMSDVHLLGIDWGHLPVWGDVYTNGQKFGRMEVNGGLTGIVPAWKLTELLHEDGVKMERDRAEAELAKTVEGAAVLDTSSPSAQQGEFEHFEDLARNLVNVPKSEIDEKRQEPRAPS